MAKPLVSIGIIFKNDIRCIERCLKALQPLRDAAPCELVMADTGSTDGSREIAEKYADILIDFPWINDFAAARNAVMDRCSGQWHFTVDTDEYLDENVSELAEFLRASDERDEPVATVTVRNYNTFDMEGNYSDFVAVRLIRMSTDMRYEGAIHEHLNCHKEVPAVPLLHTILHHDGYAVLHAGGEAARAKTERNVQMIQKELEQSPNNLMLWMQLIESGSGSTMPDYEDQVRHTVQMVCEKRQGWEQLGPPILRTALYAAEQLNMPEWDEWLALAENWFPNSMFVRLDIQYAAFAHEWNAGTEREHAILRGEQYLKALEDYRNGADPMAKVMSPLQMATPFSECEAKVNLINAYCTQGRMEDAFGLIKSVDDALLNQSQTGKLISALQDIHYKTALDTAPVITRLWDVVSEKDQSKGQDSWRKIVLKEASRTFLRKNRYAEREKEQFVRHAYTLYLPLRGKCEIGAAAAVMGMRDPAEITAVLSEVEDWNWFSIHALAHTLKCGARFPLPGKPLNVEEMDGLASRLVKDGDGIFLLALHSAEQTDAEDWQGLCWARGLLMAAVRAYPWNSKDQDEEQGMAIARAFAQVEREFLPRCYSTDALREDRLFVLPPLHRFGWYCAQAFDALKGGDVTGYVRLLREGLDVCGDMKSMVSFLADHTQEIQQAMTTPELRALADQVRVILARFDPDDPAVAALKQTDAYQKVAHLIEGVAVPVWGGQQQ